MTTCDLNCDVGEGIGNDAAIMPFISSANIACGYHAGDETTMHETILLAKKYGVAIGAHPSFADKENFGRTEIHLKPQEVYEIVTTQLKGLQQIALQNNAILHHVKPHGALYNMSAKDAKLAAAIADALHNFDCNLILFALSGSVLISTAKAMGIKTASEVFADRTYQDDGSLTSRSQPNALIEDEVQAINQVVKMIKSGKVITTAGKEISIAAETICLHGDGKNAIIFARAIHQRLVAENIKIRAISNQID